MIEWINNKNYENDLSGVSQFTDDDLSVIGDICQDQDLEMQIQRTKITLDVFENMRRLEFQNALDLLDSLLVHIA